MDKIGMRTIKTAICIFICLAIFIGLKFVEEIPGMPENFAIIAFNPFFAGIATAYSVHSTKQKSVEQAKNRCVASLIGGIIGIITISLYELISKKTWPSLVSNPIDLIIPYILVMFVSILVIYTAVKLKQKAAVFVSILTFLSCTVNPNATIATEVGTWLFGVNRIVSTVLGVLIALGINMFTLPRLNKNKDLLFAVGIEGILRKDSDKFENYMLYKFNSLVMSNVNVTLFTTRPPVTFMHLFDDSHINHPVICCSGAAIYDVNKKSYIAKEEIAYEDSLKLDGFLLMHNITPIKNYIINDTHYIYCQSIDNDGERLYIDGKKNMPYCNTFIGENNNKDNPLYYLIVEETNVANAIIEEIENGELKDLFTVRIYDYFNNDSSLNPNLKYIKIYNKKIEELTLVKDYCSSNNFRLVGLTTNHLSDNLLVNSDISVTYKNNELGRDKANIMIDSNSYDEMFKIISKLYYSKKYRK